MSSTRPILIRLLITYLFFIIIIFFTHIQVDENEGSGEEEGSEGSAGSDSEDYSDEDSDISEEGSGG